LKSALVLIALSLLGADGPPDLKLPRIAKPHGAVDSEPREVWQLTLCQAIRIGRTTQTPPVLSFV
jgi:hypothetical protein